MKPVVFKSQTEFQKSITTESKMFSIYAVGVKKGYRRETRVQIHAVVDFRNAPSLAAPAPTANPPRRHGATARAGRGHRRRDRGLGERGCHRRRQRAQHRRHRSSTTECE